MWLCHDGFLISTDWPIDLKEALRLEPANESVQQELKTVENLLLQAKYKQSIVSLSYREPTLDRR